MIDPSIVVIAIHLVLPGLPAATAARYATDIAAVAEDRDEAFAMVVTQRGESSFQTDVERCETLGKAGEVTAWQLDPAELTATNAKRACHDHRYATVLAHEKLTRLARIVGAWRTVIMRYIGAVRPDDPRAAKRLKWWDQLQEIPREATE
jgi:hypothetical protein